MPEEVKTLESEISVDYKWSPGSTVGRFLTELRDNQELLAIRCTKTSKVFLPPQSISPYGMIKMDRWVPVKGAATLKTGTIVYESPWNAPEGIQTPYMLAAIAYAGVDSEFIHLVVAPLDVLEGLKPGTELKPVFRDEPLGDIRDLQYYKPA